MIRPAGPDELQRLSDAPGNRWHGPKPSDNRKQRKGTLIFTRFGEIEAAPKKTWMVDGMIGAGEIVCCFGEPGSGKSVLMGDLACHYASIYTSWLGRQIGRGAVLYVAAERAALVKRRFAAWRQYHGFDDLPLAVLSGSIDLRSSRATADEIIGYGRDIQEETGLPLGCVFIDTVSRALNGGDENSSKDMGALVLSMQAIHDATGSAIIANHHIPQDGTQRMRGHGALIGAVDVSIGVEEGTTARTAIVHKTNDGLENECVAFALESVEIDNTNGTTAPIVVRADAPEPKAKTFRKKLADKDKLALDKLADLCLDGEPLPNGSDLPASIRAVPLDRWRDALYSAGILDQGHSSPREDFSRVKRKLFARHLAAERDGLIWAV